MKKEEIDLTISYDPKNGTPELPGKKKVQLTCGACDRNLIGCYTLVDFNGLDAHMEAFVVEDMFCIDCKCILDAGDIIIREVTNNGLQTTGCSTFLYLHGNPSIIPYLNSIGLTEGKVYTMPVMMHDTVLHNLRNSGWRREHPSLPLIFSTKSREPYLQ